MSVQSPEVVRDFLVAGLKNAHAMEGQAISLTSAQADRLKHYPDLERRVRQHLEETEGQRARLEQCLRSLDAGPNPLKNAILKAGADMAAMFHAMNDDEVIKNSFASYAFEHFEIAAYKALIEAATLAGRPDILEICRQNLSEEEAMAKWIDDNQAELVRKYLARKSANVEAKR